MSDMRRKRQKTAVDRFLDLEADDADQEEDEEDGDGVEMEEFIQEDGEASGDEDENEGRDSIELRFQENDNVTDDHGHHAFKNPFLNATSEHQESENLVALVRERARERPHPEHHGDDIETFRELLGSPSMMYATLWRVPVTRGLEEDAIWYILRYMEGLVDENSPKVQSAFARTIVPGYIFVEALSIADVRHACEGFIGYQGRYKKICLIVDNVASLLEYQHPDLKLRANSWVRVKRGMYTGDLAFLCRVDVADLEDEQFQRTQGTAYLRVIPRIPFQAKVSLKRKCRGVRPSQQFFDPFCWPKEASKLPQKPETSDPDGWIFRRGVFNSGLLDLEVPLNPLNLGNATPSRSELQLWGTCRDSDVQYFALKSLKALDEEFWVDDRVKVISGEQLGGMGVVSKVSEESVSIFLWMDILGDNGQQGPSSIEVQFMPASIRKVFEVGDYVEAVIDDNRPRRGFVIAIHQTEGEQDMVAISERGCQEFICGSSILHLRDPQETLFSICQNDEKLQRLVPHVVQRNLSENRTCLQNLWKGMPVVVLDNVAKGYEGYITTAHEIYEKDYGEDSKGPSILHFNQANEHIQHQCIMGCKSCLHEVRVGHICAKTCYRCFLNKQPIYREETPGAGFLAVVRIGVYVPAQSMLHTVHISDIRPADNILMRNEYLRACQTKDIYLCLKVPNADDVRWSNNATRLRWQDSVLKLIYIQQTLSSRSFLELCELIYTKCLLRKCNEDDVAPACNHNIASYDALVKTKNRFNNVPFWHKDKREFDTLCRYIVEDCKARRCNLWSTNDLLKDLSPCEHNTASYDAVIKILGGNRFGFAACWNQEEDHQVEHSTSDSLLDPLTFPREQDRQPYAQTPPWEPDHKYPNDSAWNPNSLQDPYWEPEKFTVDEYWLDESLRGLQIGIYLNMASGSRAHSRNTEGIMAKLMPSRERGNVINVQLLWANHPRQLHDLPIRCVVPRHPAAEHKRDPVVFIRGPLKGQFGVVDAVDGEQVTVAEIHTKKERRKRSRTMVHPTHNLALCLWPKKT